ncbi:hypothetical protein [Paenibacillus sp. OAS669]|uniref:hypothetical protein n=1 Tax=Paenibacillus sp. OAS669 TaxID=2663821 RepID=UPI00178B6CCC|nr:hypothetical protein [Paenibacillus sp. OAS669]MBE1442403.1 hypothetical protein [Paenibacillus sp. OAS669]
MIKRKLTAAYFTSWAIVLWVSFPFMSLEGAWNAAQNYLSWAAIIGMYAVPSIFLYGILISSLLELGAAKLKVSGPVEWITSGLLHAVFGLLFGFVLQSSMFSIMGGASAILFFLIDRIILAFLPYLRRTFRVVLLSVPLLLFGISAGAIYAFSPPKPPFTSMNAVQFATSGTGTVIDLFPKQAGMVKLQIEGYDVERETAVEETGEKEKYLVHFIERWSKGEEKGEHRMIYEVTRGAMGGKGGGGDEPPYRR